MRTVPASPVIVDDPPHPLGEYFERLRDIRTERYADRDIEAGKRKSRAILTMVHDEAVFFPIWLRYYSQFFTPEQIYVLDHDTSDGSTDRGGFVRIPVSHDGVSHRWMEEAIAEYQNRLIETPRHRARHRCRRDRRARSGTSARSATTLTASTSRGSIASVMSSCTFPIASRRST